MKLRRKILRAVDIGVSLVFVAGAPVIGAVVGAVAFTTAMSVVAFYVFTDPDIAKGGED